MTVMPFPPLAIDLLVTAGSIVPVEPAGVVLEHHALAVDQGRILALLPIAEARKRYQPRKTLDLPGHALMPGLVNMHTHSAMTLLRGIADDLALMDWLQNHIWPAEGANLSRAFCKDGVKLAMAEMIRGGQTCFNDMYFFPDATAEAAQEAGMRAAVGLIVIDFPSAWAQPGEYIHKGLALHDSLRGKPLIRTTFAPHAPYTVSDDAMRQVRQYATELQIPITMHVHETAGEVEQALAQSGKRPWQRLKELDLLGPDLIAVHMTQLTEEEIEEVAHYGVHVAHCAESNLKLASGFCPVHKLLHAGANVCIGTDGAASNNDLDLFGELRTASMLAKAVAGDARAMPAAKALEMATLAGAKALGWDDQIGSLLPGKAADFIAVDMSALNTQPVYNVISHLVYALNSRQVDHVWVAGQPLLVEGQLQTLVEDELRAKASEWRHKITSKK
jgi:5-methylthioadenosine/S-adenosylhomocysteine deaminase